VDVKEILQGKKSDVALQATTFCSFRQHGQEATLRGIEAFIQQEQDTSLACALKPPPEVQKKLSDFSEDASK